MTPPAPFSGPSKARILVVDDEEQVRAGLIWSLRMSGYQVDDAASGAQAMSLLARGTSDLMLLDMNMPAMDGVEVMARARRIQPDLAIVVLTGHATLESAIAAVKLGASDYLLKPVSIQGLQQSVAKALAARADLLQAQQVVALVSQVVEILQPPQQETTAAATDQGPAEGILAGALSLNVAKRIATIQGPHPHTAELTEAEAALLHELMRHPDQVRTCRQLVQAAWGYDVSEAEAAGVVRSHISRLRKKIEVDPGNPQRIKTVRGGGYYLATR